jgi:hypothetical protein
MDQAVFDRYLEERYQNQMAYYSKASAKNQKQYRQYQWILIILSATTPVLAALSGRPVKIGATTYSWDLQIFVVVIAAIVAILTSGMKTFNYQELWTTYRTTYEKLKPEIHYYNFKVGPYSGVGVDKESLFVTRVEAILDAEHNEWPPAKKLQEDHNREKQDQSGGTTGAAEENRRDEGTEPT